MHLLLAQGVGYLALGAFLVVGLVLTLLVVWGVGVVRIVIRYRGVGLAYSLVVWCVGIVGGLYLAPVVYDLCEGWDSITGGMDYVFLVGLASFLAACALERGGHGLGAVCLAAVAVAVGFHHQVRFGLQNSYQATVTSFWLLLPLWAAALAIAATLWPWRRARFGLRALLLLIAAAALAMASSGRVLLSAAAGGFD